VHGKARWSLQPWERDICDRPLTDRCRAPVIVAGTHIVWTSVDGASWTDVPTGQAFQEAELGTVIAWGSRFVAVGGTHDGQSVVWISGPQR
jgi:hypothetical protein